MTRRDWLQVMFWAGASAPSLPTLASAQLAPPAGRSPEDLADDEAFWSTVRDAFEPTTENRVNLVTVVRGVTPRATRERIQRETARWNVFGTAQPPDPEWRVRLKQTIGHFITAPADSLALLRNTTEGVTTVLMNWPLSRGDEILTSSAEHGAFYDTLASRATRDGILTRHFHLPAPTSSLDAIVEAIERALTPRTKLVMVGQVVLTGQIMPIRAIADLVHRRGAHLLVDGVLGIGHVPTDITAMDCDFYAAGFHKWGCGPRATAVFYVRPGLVERLPSIFGAMGNVDNGRAQRPLWASGEMRKYESFGAHPDSQLIALEDSILLLTRLRMENVRARLYALTRRWYSRAKTVPSFRAAVALDPRHCAGLVAWEIAGKPASEVSAALRERGIMVGGTEPYAGFFSIPTGEGRSLRIANTALFTSPADVDRLAEAIEAVARS